ncbi:MAG TPA: hypothetical protein PLW24_22195, partial [Burkholderiaceae bacterium]|nr:hypothetical protein [Burkholderiaceae bacterium]HNG82198.1 hypothetical protein [Burkholderiaceae bacterium]
MSQRLAQNRKPAAACRGGSTGKRAGFPKDLAGCDPSGGPSPFDHFSFTSLYRTCLRAFGSNFM